MKPVKSWFGQLMSHDRRKAKRHQAPQLVAYYWDGSTPVSHCIREISSTGFYLLTEQRWYPGTVVTMTLQKTGSAHGGPESSIAVQSRVVWSGADGVGLAFLLAQPHGGQRGQVHPDQEPMDKKTMERFLAPLWTN